MGEKVEEGLKPQFDEYLALEFQEGTLRAACLDRGCTKGGSSAFLPVRRKSSRNLKNPLTVRGGVIYYSLQARIFGKTKLL